MIRPDFFAYMLLLANVCHAAAVTSNGAGGGRWSEPQTWAGEVVPGNGDSVAIVGGDTVTFDVDMSGWENGVAGLSCDGTMNCSRSAGTYYLKTSADIGGAGTINCGSAETAYPAECVMIFDFDSKPNSFECGSGLTLNLYCTQPIYPVVALSEAGTAGQAELYLDTDVRGDMWTPGKTIRIDGTARSVPDSEVRVIMADEGASTVTVDTGLTNAKDSGSKVVLVTRNIRIIGSTDYVVKSMTGGTLGCEIGSCTRGISWASASTISGTISGCTYGVYDSSGCTISGVISGGASGIYFVSGCLISGTVSGCNYGIVGASGCRISGTVSGCSLGVYHGSSCMISGTISGCTSGVYAGGNTIQDAAFEGNAYDLRRVVSVSAYNTVFGSATENYEYDTDAVPQCAYVASRDHDGMAGAFKAWTRGGVIVWDVDIAPPGYANSYRHMCTSSEMPCFRQELCTVGPGQVLRVQGKILILDNHDAWPPRLELVDVRADPLIDATAIALASAAIPKPTGRYYWQDVTVSYSNVDTTARQVWIRCLAQQSGDDVYEVWGAELEQPVSP